ncbi:MAG: hypothetical protein E4H20_08935 [Spirochaetales bacterium]|nr:MAG: hypothetical protein E4H20_08935 [Spirochaetales bacterium]
MPIKSALEIAMERTKDLKADPKAIASAEARQDGKRLAGEYLANPSEVDFSARFASIAKDRKEAAREGVFEVFTSRMQLPLTATANPDADLAPVEAGLKTLCVVPFGEKRVGELFKQLAGFLSQYLDDAKKVDEAIRKQYAPRLKAKEQEMSARMGRAVRVDPMSDPDFAAFYKQNVGQMKAQYQDALDKAKEDLGNLCGIKKDKAD